MSKLLDGIYEYTDEEFKELNLSEEKVSNISFDRCKFSYCNFLNTIFDVCNFTNCEFDHCDLSVMKIKTSQFINNKFVKSKLIGIDWTGKFRYKLNLKFKECHINYSNFTNLELKDFELIDCLAQEVEFIGAKMKESICTGTDFKDSNFLRTDLRKSDFTKAINYIINPTNNLVEKSKFSMPDVLNILTTTGIIIDGYNS